MKLRMIALGLLAPALLAVSACVSMPVYLFQPRKPLVEEVVQPAKKFWNKDKIALISLSGVITGHMGEGPFDKESTLVWVKEQLKKAKDDPYVRAVVLRIDSPGGEITPSDIIYHELKDFRKEKDVPVYVSMMGLCASGGYFVAMAGDKIYAHPTTVTGSIGVIMLLPEVQSLTQKIGLSMRVIKSGERKDWGSMWRQFEPGEREMFQGMINQYYEQFVKVVIAGRPNMSEQKIRSIADGRVFTAEEAANLGLVDGVKYLQDVIDGAKKAAGVKDAEVVRYRQQNSYRGDIYARQAAPGAPSALINIDASDLVERVTEPSFEYRWRP